MGTESTPDPRPLLSRAGRRLGRLGILIADDGNLSARAESGTFWITASGIRKTSLRPGDFLRVSTSGERLDGPGRPSSEWALHAAVYSVRPDVGAVIHAHPPTATGFAAAGIPLDDGALAEAVAGLGPVPLVPYGKPGSSELEEAVKPFLNVYHALLLSNHGAVVFGRDVEDACRRMERLEHVARTVLVARLLGGVRPLTREQRAALGMAIRED
jgi:L-fuculose-phosphate aldolase